MTAGEPTWTRTRWLRVIALLFAGQLFLTWVLAERAVHPVRETKPLAPVALLTLPSANQAVNEHPSVAGATLFALVDARGFSGQAWLRTPPRETPPSEWKEPDFYLAANPDRLGLPFQRFHQTNAPQLTSAATVPAFERTPIRSTRVPPPTQSSFVVAGDLAARKLLTQLSIPLWPLAGTLRETHVNLAVDASGDVFSAVIEQSSGDAAADKQALDFCRQFRFAPSATRAPASPIGADLTWGRVIFRWRTTATSITNSPPP